MKNEYDLFIIGGGINGTAIAADAAGRGLSVMLCEKNDLASGTSWASSKLIHGGLRYLELFEFNLVRKALKEREILLFRAPHLIKPLEFILPHEKHLRPAWMIKLGLFLYDHLSKRIALPSSKAVMLKNNLRGEALSPTLEYGFSYFDCFADDARLVIANALSAKENGATIVTRTEFCKAERVNHHWEMTLKDRVIKAKVLINVSGPWVKQVQEKILNSNLKLHIKLDKGSHIVIPKLYEGDFAYILQNKDKRVVFAIPYFDHYTLIGTTDIHYKDDLDNVKISDDEIKYLCDVINRYFKKEISQDDIIWNYAGVRCLQYEPGENVRTTSRDYQCYTENGLITIVGGKLTTHRLLAEDVVNSLKKYFPDLKPAWTAEKPLPGGHILGHEVIQQYTWLPSSLLKRYLNQYGSRITELLRDCHNIGDLGIDFSNGLYQREVEYLINHEWAKKADDILWLRTKLGLVFTEQEVRKLESFLV